MEDYKYSNKNKMISHTERKHTWKIVTISLVIDSKLDSESLFKRPGTS